MLALKGERTDVCILGGGVAGLAAAHRLLQDRVPFILLEKEPLGGGFLRALSLDNISVERFPLSISPTDRSTLALIGSLGLHKGIVWHASRTGIFVENGHSDVSNPLKFLLRGPFHLRDRIAAWKTIGKIARIANSSFFDAWTVESFLEKFCGSGSSSQLLLFLLQAHWGAHFRNAPASVAIRWITRWSKRGAGKTGYLAEDGQGLLDRLIASLQAGREALQTRARVVSAERIGENFRVLWERQGEVAEVWCQAIIPALSAANFLRVAKNPPPRHALDLASMRSQGSVTLVLVLDRSIPYDRAFVARKEFPFSTLVRHGRNPYVLYLSHPTAKADSLSNTPDKEILRLFLQGLADLVPSLRGTRVQSWRVLRDDSANPLPGKGLSAWEGVFFPDPSHADKFRLNAHLASGKKAARAAMHYLAPRVTSLAGTSFARRGPT